MHVAVQIRLDLGFELLAGTVRSVISALENRKSTTLSSNRGARSWAAAIGSCWMYWTNFSRSSGGIAAPPA
jgi:hypothetical protein